MTHLYKKKRGINGIALTIIIFVVIAGIFFIQIRAMSAKTKESDTQILKDALENAVVTCYAIEGCYPESLEYIEEHYGVVIDTKKYFMDYDNSFINMKPVISVYKLDSQ